jgi:pilus assembly protein CpaB
MIRRQSLIAIGIAVVLGLVAVYLANIFLTRTEQKAEEQTVRTERVAVAAVPLDYGVQITPEKVRMVDFPVASIPEGAFRNVNDLLPQGKPRMAIRPMQVNEPILASKLIGEGMGPSLAAVLPYGKRAMSVRISDVSAVAGFIQPSDSVDVLITRSTAPNAPQVTDVLLQGVKVIAIDQNAQNPDGTPKLGRTATLEVTPIEAQKLTLAQQVGNLSLVLRRPGEQENMPGVQTVSMKDLRYSYYGSVPVTTAVAPAPRPRATVARAPRRVAVRQPAPAAPPRPMTNNVEVVRGTQGSNYEVGGYGS